MIDEFQKLVDKYVAWLRDKTALQQVNGDWVKITTPYLDRHNDCLEIYATRRDRGYLLTDDGYIMEDLVQSGCKLESPKRQELLKMTLAGFGVQNNDGVLAVHATPENFAMRKHNLIQAMLAINDLFYLAVPMVSSLFYEDVVAWLELTEIRYTPNVKFTGRSGFDHLFDFVIPKSRRQPERILQTIAHPNRDKALEAAFRWVDTKDVRSPDSLAYALLNDQEQKVSDNVLDALRNYDVRPVPWSGRDAVQAELAA
jgi:hypothetical protein